MAALVGLFFIFIFKKKLKFQKYIAIPKNFKNGPMSPMGGRQAPGRGRQTFFVKKIYKPILGQRGAGARGEGGDRPPSGDRVPPSI